MSESEIVDGGLCGLPSEVICGFRVHPAASMNPFMEDDLWKMTLDSIRKEMKVQEPMVFQGGLVLDGRNRLRVVAQYKWRAVK